MPTDVPADVPTDFPLFFIGFSKDFKSVGTTRELYLDTIFASFTLISAGTTFISVGTT